MKRKKRLMNEKTAIKFAKKVNGTITDTRNVTGARYRFTVSYESQKQIKLDSNEK